MAKFSVGNTLKTPYRDEYGHLRMEKVVRNSKFKQGQMVLVRDSRAHFGYPPAWLGTINNIRLMQHPISLRKIVQYFVTGKTLEINHCSDWIRGTPLRPIISNWVMEKELIAIENKEHLSLIQFKYGLEIVPPDYFGILK